MIQRNNKIKETDATHMTRQYKYIHITKMERTPPQSYTRTRFGRIETTQDESHPCQTMDSNHTIQS